jgi:hypothetical protein
VISIADIAEFRPVVLFRGLEFAGFLAIAIVGGASSRRLIGSVSQGGSGRAAKRNTPVGLGRSA